MFKLICLLLLFPFVVSSSEIGSFHRYEIPEKPTRLIKVYDCNSKEQILLAKNLIWGTKPYHSLTGIDKEFVSLQILPNFSARTITNYCIKKSEQETFMKSFMGTNFKGTKDE